jgi:hypothetical protein
MTSIKYAKHNVVLFKSIENRDAGTRMFVKFFDSLRSGKCRTRNERPHHT